MYPFLRSFLFRFEPERAHILTLNLLRLAGILPPARWLLAQIYKCPDKPVQAFGLNFKNPVGLAAGYDKDGLAISGLAALGFGHIEIGTVTPLPQPGNPRPRLFRLVEDEAVINRMGFPSRGSAFVQRRLQHPLRETALEKFLGIAPRRKISPPSTRMRRGPVLGVNLGKNKDTPNEQAVMDYLSLVDSFAPLADYLTINVSSPNTEGLRQLQERKSLEVLLSQIHQQRLLSERIHEKRLPILVKLAPDLSEAELDDAMEAILVTRMDGIIVTNTTLTRENLQSIHRTESGGLSGRPLQERSEAVLGRTMRLVNGQIPVVSVGGIMTSSDARRRFDMGAALVQIYSGLIFRGPGFVKEIVKSLQVPREG
ncbi:MAG: quinone-dependent dihydroorotate dehydrogenase [Chloroflexi bacterium]|nr:quinone-dependent dihydroorotate dehydrogenase [Chloroflexota bacterium]